MKLNKINILIALLFIGIFAVGCKDENEISYITVEGANKTLYPGDSFQFKLENQTADQGVEWSLYKSTPTDGLNESGDVLKIEKNGFATALDYGLAEIKATFPDGRYVLTTVNVTERPGPNNDELGFTVTEHYMNFGSVLSSLTLKVDSTLLKKYPLKFITADAEYLTVLPEIEKLDQDGYYKVTLKTMKQVRVEKPIRITAQLGNAKTFCDVYLGTEFQSFTLSQGQDATQSTYKLSVNNGGNDTIRVWYIAAPDDKATLEKIDFKVNVTGGSVVVEKHGRDSKLSGIYNIIVRTGSIVGKSEVTLSSLGKSVKAICEVYDRNDHKVESITLPKHEDVVYNSIYEFRIDDIKVAPFGITDYWMIESESSNPDIATTNVSSEAVNITFKKLGKVDIIVKLGDKQDVCHFDVQLAIQSVNITGSKAEYFVGESATWKANIVAPFENDGRVVPKWKSSNTAVATVNATTGEVKAVGTGTATISVSATDDKNVTKEDSKTITVKSAEDVKIYDIALNSTYVYQFTQTGSGETIGLWVDSDFSNYITLDLVGKINLNTNKVYTIGTDISGTVTYNDANETATIQSGTIEVVNKSLKFNLKVQKSTKIVSISGTVSKAYVD